MAINKKLIHFKTKQKFNEELANGNILDTSIVFIQDTKQIYTHGQLYDGSTFDPTDIEASIQNIIDNYATTETLNQAVQAVNSNINGVNQSINSTLQNVSEKANKAEATATDALNLVEGIQGNLSSFALKSELPTKVSQLENDVLYVTEDVVNNGLYIYDIDGKFTLPENWNTANNSKAVGVAILGDDCRFVVAKEDIGQKSWGGYGTDIASLTNYSSQTEAAKDFAGVTNTRLIIEALGVGNAPAAEACASYTFSNGQTGYLGAAGEWKLARSYKDELNSALELIGGTKMAESYYWTSTEYSSIIAWYQCFDSNSRLNGDYKDRNLGYVRAFLAIEVSKPLKERVSDLESKIKDLNTSGSSNGAYAEINHGTNDTTFTLTPNTFHVWDEVASLDLSFADETAGVANEYLFQFTSGATATTLTLPDGLKWANDAAPTIAENMIYQISVLKGFASVLEFSSKSLIYFYTSLSTFGPYQAEQGMTWEEWINSEYNSGDGIIRDNLVCFGMNFVRDVVPSDVIISEQKYNLTYLD